MQNPRAIAVIVSLIVAAAATRLLPHPPNFTAMTAACLFGGAYFQRRWIAFLVPLTALLLSDAALTYFVYAPLGMGVNWFKYVGFALIVTLGMLLRGRVTVARTASVTVLATALFFVLTNFQVWLGGDGIRYPHSLDGLLACYVAAIPFALNDLAGNIFYVTILFGGMELLKRRWPALAWPVPARPAPAAVKA